MVDRQHAQDAVKNSRVKWQGLGAGFSPGQGRRFRARRRQHLAGRVDAVPDTAKSGQGGGVVAGPTADVVILPARRESQISGQTADNRRVGSPRGVITIANLVVERALCFSLFAHRDNGEEIQYLTAFCHPQVAWRAPCVPGHGPLS